MKSLRCALGPLSLVLALGSICLGQEGPTNQIHYPYSEELGELLRTADRASKAGKVDQAVELYRSVLDSDCPGGVYQIALHPDHAAGPRRYIGVTAWAIRGLHALSPEGKKVFRSKYDYRAGSSLEEALKSEDPYQALVRAYELYPISRHSARMLETAADLALESGAFSRALRQLSRLMAHHAKELPNPPRVRKKQLLCAIGLGDAERTRELAMELQRAEPEGKIQLSGGTSTVEELIGEALRVASVRAGRTPTSKGGVHSSRGDQRNSASFDHPRVSFGAERFSQRSFADSSPIVRMRAGRILPGTLPQGGFPARNLAVTDEGTVFLLTADSLLAYDMATGERPRRILPLPGRPKFQDTNPKVQFGAAIDQGVVVAPLVEEILLDQSYRGIPIKVRIPIRKLAGFDLDRWRWSWDHARSLRGTKLERWSFPTPPVAEEGVVYASAWAIEGFVDCNVAAFDVRTGKPLWRSWVSSGQVEQTMFGEQAIEPLCVPVALDRGILYHCTSFGSVAALDADSGRPLWVTEYRQIEVRAPRGYYADTRNIHWENNGPVVEKGVVVVTPLDSPNFYGYDGVTGDRLWEASRRRYAADADMRYVMGAAQGKVVLGGGHDVRCLDVRSGKLLWRSALRGRLVAGRGCIAGSSVCVPVDRNEVFVFDLDGGRRTGRFNLGSTGNLTLSGGNLVITGNGTLAVHRTGTSAEGRDF